MMNYKLQLQFTMSKVKFPDVIHPGSVEKVSPLHSGQIQAVLGLIGQF